MTNKYNSVIYTGVTGDILERVRQHREDKGKGFTARYNLDKLVYYESFSDVNQALAREKQIKAGSRKKKNELVATFNPEYKDLTEALL